ncbi:MAG: hypothetical protein IJP92_00755 [Lachnospiraceae bacterium]|nr:hypothetical protein [Lachnospiraceae bacterium]
MTQKEAIDFLINTPVEYARLLGFDKLTDLHDEWIRDMVYGEGDKTLQSHRISYKTTCVSIALALIIILFPEIRTMFMRKTDSDVKEVVKQVQKILRDPTTLYIVQIIYNTNLEFTNASTTELSTNLSMDIRGASQLVAMGTGASITGKHFDRIFTDDIVNVEDRISKAERERTKLVYQELQNVKNKGGRIFNTGTPWHGDDCFTIMPSPEKHDCYSTGILTKGELDDLRSKMLPSLFACNYELKIIASEDVIFRDPVTGAEQGLAEQGIMHIDAAYGGADYTAMTIANRRDGKIYVFGKCWQSHVEDHLDVIQRFYEAFHCRNVYDEDNGDKGYLNKSLRKRGMKASKYHENMNKHLKICTYLVQAWKGVVFVDGTDQEYIDQICEYYEDASHDDCPDSLSSVIRIFSKRSDNSDYKPLWN